MSTVPLSPPPIKIPLMDGAYVSLRWGEWFRAVRDRIGGSVDKVDAAYVAASGAAPATSQVVAIDGLHGGGDIGGNTALRLYRAVTSVANLPTTASEGDLAYAIDGRRVGQTLGNGTGVPCWYSGSVWYAIDSGSAVAA